MFEIEFITIPIIKKKIDRIMRLEDKITDGYLVITPSFRSGLITWIHPIIIEAKANNAEIIEKEAIGLTKKNNLLIIINILKPSR